MKLSRLNLHPSINTPIAPGMPESLAVVAAYGYDIEVTPLGVVVTGERLPDAVWIPLERCVGGTVAAEQPEALTAPLGELARRGPGRPAKAAAQ